MLKFRMEECDLNNIFNPSRLKYFYTSINTKDDKESERVSKELTDNEKRYFIEICNELTKDLEELGLSVNFASKILIRKVALNMILLKKIIFQSFGTPLIRDIPRKMIPLRNGNTTTYTATYHDIETHPFFEKLIFKFQKEIDNGLKQLALLPIQQIERQKLVIIKKLKQKYKNIEEEYSIRAESQKNLSKKLKSPLQEIKIQ